MKDIKIIDDFLPKFHQREFLKILNDEFFDWHYRINADVMVNEFKQNDPTITQYDQFVRVLDPIEHKNLFEVFARNIETKLDTKIEKMLRLRLCFGIPRPLLQSFSYGTPHVDWTIPHTTIVYYANDTDGKTVLFKEFYKDKFDFSKKTVETLVEPKQGRALVFNGLRYHSVEPTSTRNRLLLNINFIEKAS